MYLFADQADIDEEHRSSDVLLDTGLLAQYIHDNTSYSRIHKRAFAPEPSQRMLETMKVLIRMWEDGAIVDDPQQVLHHHLTCASSHEMS